MGEAFVTGWGVSLPNAPVENDRIEAVLGQLKSQSQAVKRRVLMNNGIQRRFYAVDPDTGAMTHSNVDMTTDAIRLACAEAGIAIGDIGTLACGTSSPDQTIPNHASMVHAALASGPCETLSPSGVCCSGVSAMKYGYLNVLAGISDAAVVTGSELASASLRASHYDLRRSGPVIDEEDPMLPFSNEFLRWMLSDGAGALVIAPKPRAEGISLRIDWIDLISHSDESDVCMYYGLLKNGDGSVKSWRSVDDGPELFANGYLDLAQDVRVLNDRLPVLFEKAFREVAEKRGLTADSIDWLLPHYSSNWFRQKLYDRMAEAGFEIPNERWFSNLTTKGNTGSAAIYIMIEELLASGRAKPGQRILGVIPESSRMLFGFVQFTVV